MREIKFRACCTNRLSGEKMMTFTNEGEPKSFYLSRFFEDYDAEQGGILMQYTGLKDKNGKEIYEGDIVDYLYSSLEPENWEVAWEYDSWIMKRGERVTGDMNCSDDPHYNDWEEVEVIGNIYENPELIKAGK